MSRLAPRNATVQILESDEGSFYAHKCYHAVYTARQEQQAYGKLQPLLENIQAIRSAQILDVNEDKNSITLEYIPGKSLYDLVGAGIFAPLRDCQERLVKLFIAARNTSVRFDSDPSNLIIHSNTGELICIDPVCADIQLEDYTAVVFIWGLVKLVLRSLKFWQYPELIRTIRSFLSCYLTQADVSYVRFNQQMASYITVVIDWNKEISSVDGVVTIFLRRCVAIPLYSITRCLFRRNFLSRKRLH